MADADRRTSRDRRERYEDDQHAGRDNAGYARDHDYPNGDSIQFNLNRDRNSDRDSDRDYDRNSDRDSYRSDDRDSDRDSDHYDSRHDQRDSENVYNNYIHRSHNKQTRDRDTRTRDDVAIEMTSHERHSMPGYGNRQTRTDASNNNYDVPAPRIAPRVPPKGIPVVVKQPVVATYEKPSKDQFVDPAIDIGTGELDENVINSFKNGSLAFSCFVFWCCNVFFGAIAFFIALGARSLYGKQARHVTNCAVLVNVIGIAATWITTSLVVALWWSGTIYISFAPWRINHYYGESDGLSP